MAFAGGVAAFMVRLVQSSEGILTTRKLKALLESGLGGGVSSRRALAVAMCQEGEKITVHGIDAWFKHVDSNYAIPRTSLNGPRRSYPIPEQRWPVLLDIFGIELEDLALDDDSFRRWCFARRHRRPQASLGLNLAYYRCGSSAGNVVGLIDAERRWLREQGCRILDLNDAVMAADMVNIAALQQAQLLLCHLDADHSGDPLCRQLVDYAMLAQLPLLLSVEPGTTLTGRCSPLRVLMRPKTFGRRYQRQLFSVLSALHEALLPLRRSGRPALRVLSFVKGGDHDEPGWHDVACGAAGRGKGY